jgi:hypothetical protein
MEARTEDFTPALTSGQSLRRGGKGPKASDGLLGPESGLWAWLETDCMWVALRLAVGL